MASYNILQVLNDVPGKTVVLVSFNAHAAERYEVESTDAASVHATLVAANEAVSASDTAPAAVVPEVANGQIVVPVAPAPKILA